MDQMLYSGIRKRYNTFLYKNISISLLLLERAKIDRTWESETDKGRQRTQTAILTHIFLTILILYSWPYVLVSLTRGSQWDSARGHLAPAPSGHLLTTLRTSWLLWPMIHMICLHPGLACFLVITLFTQVYPV